MTLYNEIEPYAVAWLRNLVDAKQIAEGVVDGRSVVELKPRELVSHTQCHFFAGIGAWSHALKLAGWSDNVPVWTGSCPCQPFSSAGRKKGVDDARHLWPAWFRHIEVCRPPIIFGEQVASPDGLAWFDLVSSDLEGAGYAVAAADLCAAGVGAPHIRQRLYFVAVATDERRDRVNALLRQEVRGRDAADLPEAARRGTPDCGMGDTDDSGSQGRLRGPYEGADKRTARAPCSDRGFWSDAEWIACSDGKARPVEPGVHPLAYGAPTRVGRLRAYGNAIVPQVAATFIRSVMDLLV